MTVQPRGSVHISGSGSAAGGSYEEVSISGSGKLTGDIEAARLRVSGSAKALGNVKAETAKTSGSFGVEGHLEAKEFRCSGSARVGGRARVTALHASGSLKIGGDLSAQEVEVSGAGTFGGDVAAERFRCDGRARVAGLLNAETVEIISQGPSTAREIGGGEIRLLAGGCGGWLSRWWCREGAFEVETVEGDDVYLEATTAAMVRGRRVTLGPGCRVGTVEHGESLHVDPAAAVQTSTYTGSGPAPEAITSVATRPEGWARGQGLPLHGPVRNPLVAALMAAAGVVIGVIVIALVVTVVLPAVGLVVGIVLGLVGLVLLLVVVGLPFLLLGAALTHRRRG